MIGTGLRPRAALKFGAGVVGFCGVMFALAAVLWRTAIDGTRVIAAVLVVWGLTGIIRAIVFLLQRTSRDAHLDAGEE